MFYKLRLKGGERWEPTRQDVCQISAQDGTLTSPGDDARGALDMNAQCSYWNSVRARVLKQMVVWQQQGLDMSMVVIAKRALSYHK